MAGTTTTIIKGEGERDTIKRWKCVYPIYFDSERTVASGRRLGKSYCIPNPTIQHVQLAAEALNLPMAIEMDKRHPKEPFTCGRLRVQIFADHIYAASSGPLTDETTEKRPLTPSVRSLHDLIKAIGRSLPATMSRVASQTPSGTAPNKASNASSSKAISVSEAPGVTLVPRKKAKSKKK